ncbi:putative Zn finger-like uncharacterized protein [Natronospira proteinivora]|uniref:Zn finger-like uncharacterized protein n=1 Tax=Natronospira proteinivora TaxID=1807133 RepID=A0ABT1GBF0_9GAMM|nr:DUF3426 domain-containing protein [Natronospira proteinivora]MCP1728604.1 putative Zn finger-like uncharacterized protein [Natronospira proteinivora]
MFTQCPKCGSYFRVRDEELHAASGEVRCSLCTNTFNALSHLEPELPETGDETEENREPEAASESTPSTADERDPLTRDLFDEVAESRPETAPEETPEPNPGLEETTATPKWSAPPEGMSTALSPFEASEQRTPPSRGESALWMLGSILLLLLLGIQLIHAERHYWTQHAWLGEPVSRVYETVIGEVPRERNLSQLDVIRTDIAGADGESGNLRVTGVVENQGDRDQPLPAVYVRLEDRWGLNMGHGFFGPQDWIYREQLPSGFPARSRLPLRLELSDPGRDAVGFHIELCWPQEEGYACRPQRGGAAFTR